MRVPAEMMTSAAMLFERNDAFVVEAFRRGEFDYLEGVGEVPEANFFRAIVGKKMLTGPYSVEAELQGFKKYVRTGLQLLPGDNIEANIALEIGTKTEVVTVTEQTPLVDTTTGTVRSSFEPELVENIPLRSRNAYEMMRLVPGTASDWTGIAVAGLDSAKVDGAIDGTISTDTFNLRALRTPPPDSLKEFTVSSTYSAEFGRLGGAVVLMTTQSGTNALHGSAYDYFQSENLNANSFQRNYVGLGKADMKQHNPGFTVGGPVYLPKLYDGRNKTFFFIAYQDLRQPTSPYLWARGGLTAAELAGDFSQSKIIPTVSKSAAVAPNSPFAGMEGKQITNLAPYLSPAAVRIYKYFQLPLVQKSGDRFYENHTRDSSDSNWTFRGDHTIAQKNTFSFSYIREVPETGASYIDYSSPTYMQSSSTPSDHYSFQDNWMISPSIVNTLTVGYYITEDRRSVDMKDFNYKNLGQALPQPDPETPFAWQTQLKGSFFTVNSSYPFRYWDTSFEGRETVSFTLRNHFMKGGVSIGRTQYTRKITYQTVVNSTGKWLGNDAADLLVGWPDNYQWREPTYLPMAKYMVYGFFQDDWKIGARLSLNLGLRWEPSYKSWTRNGHVLKFYPGKQSTKYPNFPPGILTVGDSGFPGRSGYEDDLNNLAPRLGIAHRLNDSGTKVIRGAWGIFYNMPSMARESYMSTVSFPFLHDYITRFDHGYSGKDGWTDWFPYEYPTRQPDITKPADPLTAVFSPTTTYGYYAPSNNTGKIHQWNVTFENEFRPQWMYSVSYQGHWGNGLGLNDYWNLPALRDANDSWDVENQASRRSDQRYRYYTYTYWNPDIGKSLYHSMHLKLQARTGQLHLLTWYVLSYSRAHSNGHWDYQYRSRPFDISYEWGPPQASRVHNFLAAPSWDLPFFKTRNNWVGKLLGGWNATPVFNVQDGRPVHIIATASNKTYQCQRCVVVPNPTGQPYYNENWDQDPKLVYVNKDAFAQPAPRTYGTVQRNSLKWPYTKNVDMTVAKNFALYGERVKFSLRFDFFNLFNWVNWAVPATYITLDSPSTLAMTNNWTTAARTIQVGGKLTW